MCVKLAEYFHFLDFVDMSKGRKIIFNDRKKVLEYLDKNPNSDGITIRDNVAHDVAMNTFYDALSRMKITYKKRAKI